MTRLVGRRSGSARQAMASLRRAAISSGGMPPLAADPSRLGQCVEAVEPLARAAAEPAGPRLGLQRVEELFLGDAALEIGLEEIGLARAKFASAFRHCQTMPATPRTVASTSAAASPATAGRRRAHFQARSTRVDRPRHDRLAAQVSPQVVAQRRGARRTAAPAPSPGTSGRSSPGRAAHRRVEPPRRNRVVAHDLDHACPSRVAAWNGGRPVTRQYRIAPRA